ncbi:hypothetical protein DSL72_002044 [Monilinia vaccinii-corymbosi]|uniref:BTB domain-containing protein n=1 Tax=Monilinia vaccinii-corymbosi TaxID=61207 RepID=A0A8A3PBI0_9HELO|nr:hypothetical protein DSL72_002044 [Monilinia vaccinii-corymbosi]
MRVFHVHKKKLCDKVPHFKVLLEQSQDSIVRFPEFAPATFDVLIEWIYTNHIRDIKTIEIGLAQRERSPWDPICLYMLAEHMHLPELLDRIIEIGRRLDEYYFNYPHKIVEEVYDGSFEDSKLRKYVS